MPTTDREKDAPARPAGAKVPHARYLSHGAAMTSLLPASPDHPPTVTATDPALTSGQQPDTSVAALATALLTALTAATGRPAPRLPDAPSLAGYGARVMDLALAGLEPTTRGAYLAAWHQRLLPDLGDVPIDRVTCGAIDRAVHDWATAGHQQSAIKNTLALLARITRQAVRDGWLAQRPQALKGWQRLYLSTHDTADDSRGLALPDFTTLHHLADALTDASHDRYPGWGHAVIFAACTGARIGEVSGVRISDIDTGRWIWHARRQTTPPPAASPTNAPKESAHASSPSSSPCAPCSPRASQQPKRRQRHVCSPAQPAAASPPQVSAAPPTGTTSPAASAFPTCAATTCATPP